MNINPGELNKKIQILLPKTAGQDAEGFETERDEEVIRSCYARVKNMSGNELVESGAEMSEAKRRFLVRTTEKEITADMIVRYAGKDYNIVYVNSYGDPYTEIWTEIKERV